MLDFSTALRAALAGKVERDRPVEEVNRALSEPFASFTLRRDLPDDLLHEADEATLKAGPTAFVFPILRREVI